MKKLYLSLLTLILTIAIIFGGIWSVNKSYALENVDDDDYENYSEVYKRYLELPEEEKAKLGVIPRKYNVPMDVLYEEQNTFQRAYSKIRSIVGLEEPLPESYILLDQDTNNDGTIDSKDVSVYRYGGIEMKVEEQDYSDCWTFASLNTIETNLALNGYGDYDFSETHLDYMESLSDRQYYKGRTLHSGGFFAEFKDYLKRKDGVVLNSEVPYGTTYDDPAEIDYLKSLKQRANCKEFVDMPTIDKYSKTYSEEELLTFRNAVKKHLMENGALYASVDSEKIVEYKGKQVLNSKSTHADHAITIIGWDDEFPVENFPTSCKPQNKGAYIVLNSWGSDWGENGIFYVSYEDYLIESDMQGVKNAYLVDPLYISIGHEPAKVNYIQGESFNTTGLIVYANYQDGTFEPITNYEISPKVLGLDDTEITITYKSGETTQEVKQKIKVSSSKIKCGENIYAYYNEQIRSLDIEGTGETYDYTNIQENPFTGLNIKRIIVKENINKVNNLGNISGLEELYFLDGCNISNMNLKPNTVKIYAKKGSSIITYCNNNNIECVQYDVYYKCGDTAYAFLNKSNGNIYIEGAKDTYDYLASEIPWKDEIKNIKYVELGDDITKIGEKLFYDATGLKTVKTGKNLLQIGQYAFYGSVNLENIEMNNKLEAIKARAFYNCESLKAIDLPKSLAKMEESAFYNCKSLSYIKIPKNLEEIPPYAFCYSGLEKLDMEYGVKYIKERAFDHCESLKEVSFPETIWFISNYSFNHCINLEEVELEYGISQLGDDAFSECTKLKELVIPNSVASYGNCICRANSGLEKLKLSNSAKIYNAFCQYCSNLKEIVIPYGLNGIGDRNFNYCSKMEKARFSSSVEKIGDSNFFMCTNLKTIIIPDSVKSIGTKSYNVTATIYCKGDSYAKQYAIANSYRYIEDNTAPTILNIEESTLQSGMRKINVIAQDDNDIVGIDVYSFDGGKTWQEESYKYFGESANVEIMVKDGVGNISSKQVRTVTLEDKLIDLSEKQDGSIVGKLDDNGTFTINGEGKLMLLMSSTDTSSFFEKCGINTNDVKTIIIGNGITRIGNNLFYRFQNLKNVIFSQDVETIGSTAFGLDSRLIISIHKDLKNIGSRALFNVKKVYYNSNCDTMNNYIKNVTNNNTSFVIDDVGPEIESVKKEGNKVTVTATDKGGTTTTPNTDCSGIYEYSFDGGTTWQESNEFTGNIENIKIFVKDNVGNETEYCLLTKIEVTTAATKLSYIEGQDFDAAGMVITASYSNGKSKVIQNYTVTNGNNLTKGQKSVTISYKENGITVTTTLAITVAEKELLEINITKAATKLNYVAGQDFDKTGMIVTASYNNGKSEDVQNYIVTNGNKLAKGQTSVTISYTEGNVTKTAVQDIVVTVELLVEFKGLDKVQKGDIIYLESIKPIETIKGIENKIETNGTIEIFEGAEKVINNNRKLVTGMTLRVSLNNNKKEYICVIAGDLTGDGEMDDRDLLKLARFGVGLDKNLSGAFLEAANVYKDDNCGDDIDLLKMSRMLVGLEDWN